MLKKWNIFMKKNKAKRAEYHCAQTRKCITFNVFYIIPTAGRSKSIKSWLSIHPFSINDYSAIVGRKQRNTLNKQFTKQVCHKFECRPTQSQQQFHVEFTQVSSFCRTRWIGRVPSPGPTQHTLVLWRFKSRAILSLASLSASVFSQPPHPFLLLTFLGWFLSPFLSNLISL